MTKSKKWDLSRVTDEQKAFDAKFHSADVAREFELKYGPFKKRMHRRGGVGIIGDGNPLRQSVLNEDICIVSLLISYEVIADLTKESQLPLTLFLKDSGFRPDLCKTNEILKCDDSKNRLVCFVQGLEWEHVKR